MVSILPSARTGLDVLSEHLGMGMTNAMPQMYQNMQYQRGMSAIDQLQNALQPKLDANGNPIPQNPGEMIAHLARAISSNPSLERSGLGSKMLELMQQGMFPAALAAGAGAPTATAPAPQAKQISATGQIPPTSQIPSSGQIEQVTAPPISEAVKPISGKKTAKDIDASANQYIAELRPDLVNPESKYGAVATFNAPVKMDLTPQEEAGLRQELMAEYKTPNLVNQVIDTIRNGIKNRFLEAQAEYGFDKDRLAQIQNKWNTFTQSAPARLEPHIGKFASEYPRTAEELKNKYMQYAGGENIALTPEQMHTNAMANLQNDINKIDALHAGTSMPPIRNQVDVTDWIDEHKDTYQDFVKNGMMEVAREDAILNKDVGNEEFHALVYGDQTNKNLLGVISEIKPPQEYSKIDGRFGPSSKYNKNFPQEKEKYLSDISNKLLKMSDKDDLVLLRAAVLNNGGTEKDFKLALRKAQENGLKLSEFQKSQLQEIDIPRVMPLYEFFSDKKFKEHGLRPLMNYLRGKR